MNKRIIKFRAWHKEKKVMMMAGPLDFWFQACIDTGKNPFTNDIVMLEFTGLKDKNGREIYEGDIVKGSAFEEEKEDLRTGEIAWLTYRWEVIGIETDGEFSDFAEWCDGGNIEVIGNIYENPELLEKKER